ncbi:hypothetical protein AQ490_24210 [Wenjunlia vitaminophila]|uniref:Methyltransferase domain-containing protein n=1 Tax=Wenjunlia vitaminophila TaxID=76728 RepID=A0A0T6LRA3_WENVI|nr:methyltransferase domain-containing protein [Wenjunlia vitaminophila]KRV48643.1 hypothetical protein AQ490_24210 [Wenjunlia vitaminophila]
MSGYAHLTTDDLVPPDSPHVFFDPADTETGVWVANDLLTDGCSVLDLGSGSGAAAAAMVRAGAARVHGVDAGAESVAWAMEHYASPRTDPRVTVAQGDFSELSTNELLATAPTPLGRPIIVTSTLPYVPLPEQVNGQRRSIAGGDDGLKWAPTVIRHARSLGSDLGLSIASYSSPRRALRLLRSAGYRVESVTLAALPLGEFTLQHSERVLALEETGEAVLWRTGGGPTRYFILGLACRWVGAEDPLEEGRLTGDMLLRLLRVAARSRTGALEALDERGASDWSGTTGWSGPVRVLDLPPAPVRQHC